MRAADRLDVWIAINCITDWKRVVPRHAETVFDTLISNSLDDVINYRSRFHSCHLFLKLSKTDISKLVKFRTQAWTQLQIGNGSAVLHDSPCASLSARAPNATSIVRNQTAGLR